MWSLWELLIVKIRFWSKVTLFSFRNSFAYNSISVLSGVQLAFIANSLKILFIFIPQLLWWNA